MRDALGSRQTKMPSLSNKLALVFPRKYAEELTKMNEDGVDPVVIGIL